MRTAVAFSSDSFHAHQTTDRNGIDAFLYGETSDAAILAFRGTLPVRLSNSPTRLGQILTDWINNTSATLVRGSPFGLPGYVHQGFAGSLDNLWTSPGGLQSIFPYISRATAKGKRFLVTGHSKGGALACLAALRLAETGETELKPDGVCTFAAPRAGNHEFAAAFDRAFTNRARRFEFQDDIVPHLPPSEGFWFALQEAFNNVIAHSAKSAAGWSWPSLIAGFTALTRVGTYESAGQLQFIDWNGNLRDQDTAALQSERLERLGHALAGSLPDIAKAHLPMRGFGYMSFLENRA